MQKKTPEQQAVEDAAKEAERAEAVAQRVEEAAKIKAQRAQEAAAAKARQAEVDLKARVRQDATRLEEQREAFFESPASQAQVAYERGDLVFQCSFDVMSQQAIIIAMVGSDTTQSTNDPTYLLNQICREGWDLVTGSFVFIEQEQQSRDKFLSTGQNVAITGKTVGYYVFKRCPGNRRDFHHSWETTPAIS